MNVIEKFQCSRCGEVHDWEDDAAECCQPDVRTVFVCGSCDQDFESKADADACCGDLNFDTPEGYRRHIAELEAAGQQRLPI